MDFQCIIAAILLLALILVGGFAALHTIDNLCTEISRRALFAAEALRNNDYETSAAEIAALHLLLKKNRNKICILAHHVYWDSLNREVVRAQALVQVQSHDELLATLMEIPLCAQQIADHDRLSLDNIF